MCSGGGSTGTGTGGAASSMDGGQANPPDSETHCTTTRTGTFHRVLQPIACEDESDCPDGFSCEGGASSRAKSCLPPYYELKGVDRGEHAGSTDGGGQGAGENPPTTPSSSKHESSGCSAAPGESNATIAMLALFGLLFFALGVRSTRRLAARGVQTRRRS